LVDSRRDVVGLCRSTGRRRRLDRRRKGQSHAFDRTQPGLPMKKGRAGTMTHDCNRNGATTLPEDPMGTRNP
jgi:hypothetical protein